MDWLIITATRIIFHFLQYVYYVHNTEKWREKEWRAVVTIVCVFACLFVNLIFFIQICILIFFFVFSLQRCCGVGDVVVSPPPINFIYSFIFWGRLFPLILLLILKIKKVKFFFNFLTKITDLTNNGFSQIK